MCKLQCSKLRFVAGRKLHMHNIVIVFENNHRHNKWSSITIGMEI